MSLDFNRILFVNSYVCNMNCPYCMHAQHKKNKHITSNMSFGIERSKNLFDLLIKESPYEKIQITFSGGEPLVFFNDYLIPMIKYIRQSKTNKRIVIDLFTNGTLLNKENILFFKKYNVRIGVSYDGHCGQKYRDEHTQQRVENNLKLGATLAPEIFSIASTFDRNTFQYMYDSFLTCEQLGIKYWSFAVDTLEACRETPYSQKDIYQFYIEVQKIWNDLLNHNISVNTFEKIKHFKEYCNDNKAIIARPDGEICIGTTVPILIPEQDYPFLSIGYNTIDFNKLQEYYNHLGEFHIHALGKNNPIYCQHCYVKDMCQNSLNQTIAEQEIRKNSDPMHCLEYLLISEIMQGIDI